LLKKKLIIGKFKTVLYNCYIREKRLSSYYIYVSKVLFLTFIKKNIYKQKQSDTMISVIFPFYLSIGKQIYYCK